MERPSDRVEDGRILTLDEYLALPEHTRTEVVDGVLRPMTRPSKFHRRVQRRLASLLERQMPIGLQVEEEEIVDFGVEPPTLFVPDVVVFRPDKDPEGRKNSTHYTDVLLCAEVVSPSTQTADRYDKPALYARNGIPSYWRLEPEPELTVIAYTLEDTAYRETGRYISGYVAVDKLLEWIEIPVKELLGDYAR